MIAPKVSTRNKYGLRKTHIKIHDYMITPTIAKALDEIISPAFGRIDGFVSQEIADRYQAIIRVTVNYIKATEEYYYDQGKDFSWDNLREQGKYNG